MKPTYVVILGVVALAGMGSAGAAADSTEAVGVVTDSTLIGLEVAGTADGGVGAPPWPGNDTTTGEDSSTGNNSTGVSPGQSLAGAVGAQGASLQGELWNRTITERLANATTADQRAEVVADEIDALERYVDALESIRENVTGAWEDGEMSEGEYRATLSGFVVRAHSVELRANRTAEAAADLPDWARETHDINVTHVRNLEERAHELHQFEGEIAREVANETLSNVTVRDGPPESDESDDDEDDGYGDGY